MGIWESKEKIVSDTKSCTIDSKGSKGNPLLNGI